ncbi:MAG: MFS transporter, partial [Chloroflexi bacterium]|nr:MFS transporter [Chloroflexota bacterium]
MAVATLSVFVVPMTRELGWSRGLFSGAVSVGGLCAVVISPLVGKWIDRHGSGLLLAASSVLTGGLAVGLSLVGSPLAFYAMYVPGRMIFSGPVELGIPTSISNWFIRRRPLALAVDAGAKGAGLAVMPLAAQF